MVAQQLTALPLDREIRFHFLDKATGVNTSTRQPAQVMVFLAVSKAGISQAKAPCNYDIFVSVLY